MLRTIVERPEGSKRRSFRCPECQGTHLKKLTQGEVFLTGEYPAPQVQVRECRTCGTLSEFDKWIADRMFWIGVLR